MRIKILGTRGEIKSSASYHSKHSGVLVDGLILLDLGERAFLKYQPKYIFVTHLHPDHAFFIREPIANSIPIFAPETNRKATNIIKITDVVKIDSYIVTPVPTHHSKKVTSTGYLIDNGKEKLLYTGDVIWINKGYHHLFNGLNLVITEGSFIQKGGMVRRDKETGQIYGHAGIPDLVNLFGQFTKHIMLVHFGSWFYKGIKEARRKLAKLGKSSGVTIHIGYDGMELDLDNLPLK
jgi:ribonuclease BN (tRNA processing enzyme)